MTHSLLDHLIKFFAMTQLAEIQPSDEISLKILLEAHANGFPLDAAVITDLIANIRKEENWSEQDFPVRQHVLNLLTIGMEIGCAESTTLLASYSARGLISSVSLEESVSIYHKAASQGSPQAHRHIGELWEGKFFHPRDNTNSFAAFSCFTARTMDLDAKKTKNSAWLAEAAFVDQGFGFSSTNDLWNFSNIWKLKSLEFEDPYSKRLSEKVLTNLEGMNESQLVNLHSLAESAYFGFGFRQDKALARKIWRQMRHKSENALVSLATDAFERREISERNRAKYQHVVKATIDASANLTPRSRLKLTSYSSLDSLLCDLDSYTETGSNFSSIDAVICRLLFAREVNIDPKVFQVALQKASLKQSSALFDILSTEERVTSLIIARNHVFDRLADNGNGVGPWKLLLHISVDDIIRLKELFCEVSRDHKGLLDYLSLWSDFSLHLDARRRATIGNLTKRIHASLVNTTDLYPNSISSNFVLQKLSTILAKKESTAEENLINATINIGPDHNARDNLGLPTWERANDSRSWLTKNRINKGWDRILKIAIDQNRIYPMEVENPRLGKLPLVFNDDLVVIAILALIEPFEHGGDALPPSLSLEPLIGERASLKIVRKIFSNPSWLRATSLGQSMYYADSLLFINSVGTGVFSIDDPFITPVHSDNWQTPNPWVKASNSGGVVMSRGRNAFLVNSQLKGSDPQLSFDSELKRIEITTPQELVHFDGSERVYDRYGIEINRDGGRHWLRYSAVRHADVLTYEFESMKQHFPVFERVAHLLGMYSTLRQAFNGKRKNFTETKLWNNLIQEREKYVKRSAKIEKQDSFVLAH